MDSTSYQLWKKGPKRTFSQEERVLWAIAHKAKKLGTIREVPSYLSGGRAVHRSKKGKMGAIVVNRDGRLRVNGALRFVRGFADGIGGNSQIIDALSALEEKISKGNAKVLAILKEAEEKREVKSLARAIAEAGAEPVSVVKAIIDGQMALGKMEAMAELALNQGAIMRDLLRHAMDQTDSCKGCLGYGFVPGQPQEKLVEGAPSNKPCPICEGSGKTLSSSKHKEWAMTKALEISELGPGAKKGVEVNVNTAIGVKVEGAASSRLAQLAKVSDEILYQTKKASEGAEVVDGEILSSSEVTENG